MPGFTHARWLAAIGFVVATTLSSCAGEVTTGEAAKESSSATSTAPTTTSPTKVVDANAAFGAVEKARQELSCTPLLANTLQASFRTDVPAMRDNAAKYRDLVTAWEKELGAIEFPADAAPVVTRLKASTAAEVADLNTMATAADNATPQDVTAMANSLNFHETSVRAELDELSAALGHPEPPAFVAGNRLELAYGTFRQDSTPVWPMFEEAVKKGDLAGAKAANDIEQKAAERYIATLDAIKWPPGYDDKVKTLQDALRGVIEFDRKQVDVPTVADILPPEQGTPVVAAADNAKAVLMDAVMTEALKAGALPKC